MNALGAALTGLRDKCRRGKGDAPAGREPVADWTARRVALVTACLADLTARAKEAERAIGDIGKDALTAEQADLLIEAARTLGRATVAVVGASYSGHPVLSSAERRAIYEADCKAFPWAGGWVDGDPEWRGDDVPIRIGSLNCAECGCRLGARSYKGEGDYEPRAHALYQPAGRLYICVPCGQTMVASGQLVATKRNKYRRIERTADGEGTP